MRLPRKIGGLSGSITVKLVEDISPEDDRLGTAVMQSRTILLKQGQDPHCLVNSVTHELMHHALWDSGQHRHMTETQIEAMCDVVGAMMAASGLLRFDE
jgi:hypothetical protein